MSVSKRERVGRILHELSEAHPFASFSEAWSAIDAIIRRVEDEVSGIPEDPNAEDAQVSDGRIYPPTLKRELKRKSPLVRSFRHIGHRTSLGENGAILIEHVEGNVAVLDLPGKDGRQVADLLKE